MFEVPGNIVERGELKEATTAAKWGFATLQCYAFRVLVRLPRTYFVERGEDLKFARQKVIRLTKFSYVSSRRAPTLKDRVIDGFVELDDDCWRVVQRAVATELFYGSSEERYDTVLVSGGNREGCTKNCESLSKILVWLEKSLAFKRAALDTLENRLCSSHKKKCYVKCAYDPGKQNCFIQWYEAIKNQIVKVDKIYIT